MKSIQNKTGKLLTMLFLVLSLAAGMTVLSFAATKVPSRVRTYTGYSDGAIEFTLPEHGARIKNLKANKGMITRVTEYDDYRPWSGSSSEEDLDARIGVYVKKTGKYKVTFDIVSAAGQKLSSHKVTVFVKNDSPVKSFTYAGKDSWEPGEVRPKSGRIKVVMNKGYTLKKIEVGTYKKKKTESGIESEMVFKTVKNNAKIKLGTTAYHYEYTNGKLEDEDDYYSHYMNKNMSASTQIRITYKDKWTKQTDTWFTSISQLAKN